MRTFNCKCPRCSWTARYMTNNAMFDLACPHCGCMRLMFQVLSGETKQERGNIETLIEETDEILDVLLSIGARLIVKAGL